MTDTTENEERIHWQDLAQQLGAEPSDDLTDYFAGTTRLAGEPIEDDELGSPGDFAARAAASAEKQSELVVDVNPQIASTMEEPVSPEIEATEISQTVASEQTVSETAVSAGGELQIDWGSQPVRPVKSDRKKRTKTPDSKPRSDASVDLPRSSGTLDSAHWDNLASSLGLAAPSPVPPADSSTHSEMSEAPKGIGAESADLTDDSNPMAEDPTPAILDEIFVPREISFDEPESKTEPEDVEVDSKLGDSGDFEEEADEREVEEDADEHYVEFEIQDLHRGGDSSRPREPQRQRPARPPGRDHERSRDERDSQGRRGGQRSEKQVQKVPDDQPEDNDSETSVEPGRGSSPSERRKPRRQPTWQEAIDFIVDANLSTRKKTPRRRRGRGRGKA